MSPLLLTLGKPLFAFVAGALMFGVASTTRMDVPPKFEAQELQVAPHRHLVEPGQPRIEPIPQVEEAPVQPAEEAEPK